MAAIIVNTEAEAIILSEVARITEYMTKELNDIASEAARKAQDLAAGQFVSHMPDTTRLNNWAKERDGLLNAARAMNIDAETITTALALTDGKRARFDIAY